MPGSALSMGKFVKGLPVAGKPKADKESTSNVTTTKQRVYTRHERHDKKQIEPIMISDSVNTGCGAM